MKPTEGKTESLEETAEAVSMIYFNLKGFERKIFCRFVIEVVNVFQSVSIMKMPMKLKHYFNALRTNKMVDWIF
jgi:hypothetical protein